MDLPSQVDRGWWRCTAWWVWVVFTSTSIPTRWSHIPNIKIYTPLYTSIIIHLRPLTSIYINLRYTQQRYFHLWYSYIPWSSMIYSHHFPVIFSSSPQQESTARIALQLHADEEAQAQLQVAAGWAPGQGWWKRVEPPDPPKSTKIIKDPQKIANIC